jgi:hypothetical protein
MHYRLALGDGAYLEPHLRRYRQSAADFFHFFLPAGSVDPTYFSADPRLAKFDATTVGIKWGTRVGHAGELNIRLEQYSQKGSGPDVVPTQLQGLDLYPGLKAWLVQGGFRFLF